MSWVKVPRLEVGLTAAEGGLEPPQVAQGGDAVGSFEELSDAHPSPSPVPPPRERCHRVEIAHQYGLPASGSALDYG